LQGGGKRGYRVDAETAAGGGLVTTGALDTKAGGADENDAAVNLIVAATLTAREGKGPDSDATSTLITHALTAEGADASEDETDRGTPLVPVDLAQVTSAGNRSNPKEGDPAGTLSAASRPAVAFNEAASGNSVHEEVAPPIKTGTAGGATSVFTSAAVRRLTPTECERLQGFPDRWTATSHGQEQSDSARYRQLGNSIAVPVFVWVASRIVAVDRGETP
jgi:DNA (cytosine-5)-methyltransferase 1